ncbi:MAG: 2-hydroxyacyl-CoA dehydratase family protein [Dehalococcoidia bacterium]
MDPQDNMGLERVREEIANYEGIRRLLESTPMPMNPVHLPLVKNVLHQHYKTVECVEQGKPLAATYFTNAPEIFTAMDIHWYMAIAQSFGGGGENPHMMEDLEGVDHLPVASDVCTLLRLALYYLDAGVLPKPTMIIPLSEPCDGVVGLHEAMRNHRYWKGIPVFTPDPPYYNDERSIDYFADELRRMVAFLTEQTGRTLDLDRLRKVVEITNEQYILWAEYNELRRAVPCPHGHVLAMAPFTLVYTAGAGNPAHTRWFKDLIADAERRIKENDPEVPNQKIRVLWFDVQAIWFSELAQWMQDEWGVSVVECMFGYAPYTTIDTSTEESIFRGLARRNLMDPPMVRQARGTVDGFLGDITRLVTDFKIDCVILPGHMGHKDGSASISIMRDKCRELGVPFLVIGVDQFDRRYTTMDEMKDRISQFFTAMGLG